MTAEKILEMAVYSKTKNNYCVVLNEVSIFFDDIKETKSCGVLRVEFFLRGERVARIPVNYINNYY